MYNWSYKVWDNDGRYSYKWLVSIGRLSLSGTRDENGIHPSSIQTIDKQINICMSSEGIYWDYMIDFLYDYLPNPSCIDRRHAADISNEYYCPETMGIAMAVMGSINPPMPCSQKF